ncbi:MAG TPA: malto-oligosyltrehalose trehalohydrolase [Solirubrobacteraceae bacterium]|nr:malto-oligosyltrehalose trehalohydrolase [Solirubrobacteraceae bacterium]
MIDSDALGDVYPWERPLGARQIDDERAEFRVWAPRARTPPVLVLDDQHHVMDDEGWDVYQAVVPVPEPGRPSDYGYLLGGGDPLPDPASRWQPDGLRGPSRLLDARALPGRSGPFTPPARDELIIYELHIGTFSEAGTFAGAIEHLSELAEIGVTAIEIMPVAEFPGRRGWGYDGVYISAAQSSYGGPLEFAGLVAAAHEQGLAVILDVVYNHLGASGAAAMEAFGPYFTGKYETPWGKAMNYDDAQCDPVREWVCQSAEGWVRDFGVDGLRLDALHAIFDSSPEHIVAEVARRVHDLRPHALVIAESGMNDPIVMRPPERGGWHCDAAWADDFHHALRTLLTEDRDGYYADFGLLSQMAKAFHRPHVDDGEYSPFRRRRFGAPAEDIPPEGFVVFSQNHDQVGNRAYGDRMPAAARPLAAFCTLLSPFIPLLFMGEEYGELAPFQYFTNHIDPDIAQATREGRRSEFAAFAQFAADIPDSEDPATFERSKLTRQRDQGLARLYRELIAARRRLPRGTPREIEYDERARWLIVRRGPFEIACNFGIGGVTVPCEGETIELAAGGDAHLSAGSLKLSPMSGALIR